MIKIPISTINKDHIKPTFVGKIKFSDLDKIAKLTYRSDDNDTFFQRPTDKNRVDKIASFIEQKLLENKKIKKQSDITTLFPTAIIIALDDDFVEVKEDCLIISETSAFIVDGQHRFRGIKRFYENNSIDYEELDLELPLTILLGYDFYEQAQIFIDVNFKQKPVNKSFYYDIFGSLPGGKSEMKLAHFLVKHLNDNPESPFFGLVKMLGLGDGVISQAFLVEKIISLFKANKAFSILYYDYENGVDGHKKIAQILISYFSVVRDRFIKYYPVKNNNGEYSIFNQDILFKTTGVGALLKIINEFSEVIKDNKNNEDGLKKIFDYSFSLVSTKEAEELFSKNGDYAKGGGGGLQSKLYNKIKEIINYKKGIIGSIYDNAIILDIKRVTLNDKQFNEITMSNDTKTIISDEDIEKIKKASNYFK